MLPHPPTFIVNHGGAHFRSRNTLKKSDIRIGSYESLNLIAEPLQIFAIIATKSSRPRTIDVWMYANLSVKELLNEVPVETFISQWEKLEVEYMEAVEKTRRNASA